MVYITHNPTKPLNGDYMSMLCAHFLTAAPLSGSKSAHFFHFPALVAPYFPSMESTTVCFQAPLFKGEVAEH